MRKGGEMAVTQPDQKSLEEHEGRARRKGVEQAADAVRKVAGAIFNEPEI